MCVEVNEDKKIVLMFGGLYAIEMNLISVPHSLCVGNTLTMACMEYLPVPFDFNSYSLIVN